MSGGNTTYSDFIKDYDDYRITLLNITIKDHDIVSRIKQLSHSPKDYNNILFVFAAFYIVLIFLLLPYFIVFLPLGVLLFLAIRYAVFYWRKNEIQKIIATNDEIYSLLFAYQNR